MPPPAGFGRVAERFHTGRGKRERMRRRRLLGAGAALSLFGVAGCIGEERPPSGPRRPPETPRDGEAGTEGPTEPDGSAGDGTDSDATDERTETAEPPGDLRVASVDFDEGTEGTLLVIVDVENAAEEERSGHLRVRVVADGMESTVSRPVTVSGSGTVEEEVEFDVEYERFAEDGIVDADVTDD